jgi:predicted transcriptional regulator
MPQYPSINMSDPAQRRLRALMMLRMRVGKSASYKDIAKEFNVTPDTVKRTLKWAEKAGLLADAEDKIIQELLPAAHAALLKALASADEDVAGKYAIEIFKGTVTGFKKEKASGPSAESHDLSSYINQLRSVDEPLQLTGTVLDGELATESEPARDESPAATSPVSEGDAGSD